MRLETPGEVSYSVWGYGWAMLRTLVKRGNTARLRAMEAHNEDGQIQDTESVPEKIDLETKT